MQLILWHWEIVHPRLILLYFARPDRSLTLHYNRRCICLLLLFVVILIMASYACFTLGLEHTLYPEACRWPKLCCLLIHEPNAAMMKHYLSPIHYIFFGSNSIQFIQILYMAEECILKSNRFATNYASHISGPQS